jgi:hypothetical protein
MDEDKRVVTIGSRLATFIGAKATREKRLQAAAMQAEFTLRDTLIMLCYLAKDLDEEIATHARKNLIAAARSWHSRPDRPDLPEPIYEIVQEVIRKVGLGAKAADDSDQGVVTGNIALLGLGEIIQTADHNNRTACVSLIRGGETIRVYTEKGKVVGALGENGDGLDVLYTAFGWVDASFTYQQADPGPFQNRISVNTLNLVMDALERAPEEDPFDREESKKWRVQGALKVMNLFEIAEIFEMNSRQAVCLLKRDSEKGLLYFKNSRIVNASFATMEGMDAACHLLAWPNADFEIFRGGEDVSEVIHMGMQNLIIEAMRLLDEGVTVTDQIASELALINELFEGRELVTLPVLEKVRLVFSDDQKAREALETDSHPLVRKALKVKISTTVYKYLNPATDHDQRLKAARGIVPLSTTEKLVLLSYLSHDESQEIREQARQTLDSLDLPTYRKGLGADLHPSVMDFLVRETIRDESLIQTAASSPTILEETAIHILDNWKGAPLLKTLLDNKPLIEKSPSVVAKITTMSQDDPDLAKRIQALEEAMLHGNTDWKVEGELASVGLPGLVRAAKQGGRSGTIVVESPKASGRVFFKRGRTIGAISGTLEGQAALEALLGVGSARFRYLLRTHFHVENLDSTSAEEFLETAAPSKSEAQLAAGASLMNGSLKTMDIFEGLTALEGTPVPVGMLLICEEGSGEIYRDRSRILDVRVEGIDDPHEAMGALLSWNGLRFIARQAPADQPVRVDKSLQDFYSESIRLISADLLRMTSPGTLPEWELSEAEFESLYHRILQMGVAEKIKLALLGNKEARDILVRDSNKIVSVAVVKSPKIQEAEIETISKSRSVSDDVLRHIASSKEWMKSYSIKFNLASNAKTPIPIAMRLLTQLREQDLRKLAKSKNVSQTLANQARRLAEAKKGA